MRSRPVIGIPTRGDYSAAGDFPRYSVLQQYVKALERSGAAVVLLPPQEAECLHTILNMSDGLLLAGGTDLSLGNSGPEASQAYSGQDPERDLAEMELASRALDKDVPVLGICRGMQLLNMVSGGSLFVDIGVSVQGALTHTSDWRAVKNNFHPVNIVPGTILWTMAEQSTPRLVNGNHHQCVNNPGRGMIVSATAPDGVIEAIECPSKRFVVAVQWHPEWLMEGGGDRFAENIFAGFVAAAKG